MTQTNFIAALIMLGFKARHKQASKYFNYTYGKGNACNTNYPITVNFTDENRTRTRMPLIEIRNDNVRYSAFMSYAYAYTHITTKELK